MPDLSCATLLLIRHASTTCGNETGLMCGRYDAPLNTAGRLQVEALRTRLAVEEDFAALYSSCLSRALETAQAAPARLAATVRALASLAEISCGTMEGLSIEDVRQKYPELWRCNQAQADENFGWPHGETYRAFRRRILRAVRMLACRHAGQRILVVTHAGVINQILGSIAGQSAARWENFRPGTASITEVSWCGESGQVLRFDDRMHLASLASPDNIGAADDAKPIRGRTD